ncbi:hypothetical protein LOTGIDRAFT_161171 [Lottia gigantea]|uniref:Uncharacterized protein n=1 Tax=Lottia gigantea TaxID=225164 RepID=V4BZA6_LOTGI|nr:hypothetical protein LOTGIDRAFT_161171 [Lottia gigantea]ESO94474.1 hypothetical protein LOTGIDRAFT_161171 [Lottia gigantea]
MEVSELVETTKLASLCDVPVDQGKGKGPARPTSLKREGNNPDGWTKPRRSVQFPSDDNLVFIKEIPPRGFFGSDVSESDDSEGDDNESEEEESGNDDDEDDDEDSDVPENKPGRANPKAKVIPGTQRSYIWPRVEPNKPTPAPIKSPIQLNEKSGKKSVSAKRPRLLSRSQRRGNRMENGSRASNKFRKNHINSPTVMKPTISSKTKQTTRNQNVKPTALGKQSNSPKYPAKITIDSPIPVTNETRSSDDNNVLYNYYVSGKMCQVKGFIFPLDHNESTIDYLPSVSGMDFKPFSRHRRHNAWQLANGTLDSTLFHTPSIAPMWENIQTVSIAKLKSRKHDS